MACKYHTILTFRGLIPCNINALSCTIHIFIWFKRFCHRKKDHFEDMIRRGSSTRLSRASKNPTQKNTQKEIIVPGKSVVTSDKSMEELANINDEDTTEILPRKPKLKSPFKAVRGEGNSFLGWSS